MIEAREFLESPFLPWVIDEQASRLLVGTVDAFCLTIIVAPVLWLSVVLPLQRVVRMRESFLTSLFRSFEDERRRIAHDVHDGVGQSLTLLISGLRSLPDDCDATELQRRKSDLRMFAERALSDVKQLAIGLRPSLLDDFGLVAALERLVAETSEHQGIHVQLISLLENDRLPEAIETAFYRITQEALSNVTKHAQAKQVVVTLTHQSGRATIEIRDDGRGLDAIELRAKNRAGGHLGIQGMQVRTAQLNGQFQIAAVPGGGGSGHDARRARIGEKLGLKTTADFVKYAEYLSR